MKRFIPLMLALLAFPYLAVAETVYIGDTLYVPLRSGPGSEFRIINRALKTGTAMTLLEKEQDNGYYKVQTKSGQDGYVPGQYVLFEPPAMLQLKAAQDEAQKLRVQVRELTSRLQTTEADLQEKTFALTSNTQAASSLQSELNRIKAISEKSLELDKRNRELVLTNEQLMAELQTLQISNQQLTDTSEQRWYIYGAGTLLFGLLIGFIAPLLQPKRKKSNWA